MSNPTTPFSWQMPTATDLVTDLPADFEVFGQAVATSMADLLGGTSGQILAKNSNTDMDFVWIANDQGDITGVTAGNGISVTDPTGPVPTVAINTAVTADLTTAQTLTNKTLTSPVLTTPSISNINAKADILVGTADNTLGILSVGTNGQVLTADSTVSPSGLKWATPSASASGLTLITTQTVSNVATITFDNVFNSTYKNYLVIYDDIYNETTVSADLYFQFRYAGPTTQTSHNYAMNGASSSGTAITIGNISQTYVPISRNMGQSGFRINGQIFVTQVGNDARVAGARGQNADLWGEELLNYAFFTGTSRVYTGFIISTSTGNMSGTFTVYGLQKS